MYIQVNDGKVVFATHVVRLDQPLPEPIPNEDGFINEVDHEIQQEMVCFSQAETDAYVAKMDEKSLAHTIETLSWSTEMVQKASEHTYNSRSEAIEDLQGNRPLSDAERVAILEKQLAETQTAVNYLLGV